LPRKNRRWRDGGSRPILLKTLVQDIGDHRQF
jgi:hypothetical protein